MNNMLIFKLAKLLPINQPPLATNHTQPPLAKFNKSNYNIVYITQYKAYNIQIYLKITQIGAKIQKIT